ncbi:Alpha-1,2-mannosidase [Arcticibacter svalbardensis MN12-7]|uniref:Alpha-1,2-mannosidase n=1 Tax=Arcticibacter svalbardensis MN12-7 TaxID=1150600 RepID=R9GLV1_9SPHI|nr:GH92 family glycosyl hydrolase [Arcticibacter svalbardensis]EOR92812.1 Alpha-1,2-mannosidase [Arcticibacter svalbardensis MN12-7]
MIKLKTNKLPSILKLLTNFVLGIAAVNTANAQDLLKYVQPLSGTAASTTEASVKHSERGSLEQNANTIPAVAQPFAMTQWTPQTRETEVKCQPPYFYKDSLWSGFRGTHWLSGSCTQDYGSFTVMPIAGSLKTLPKDYELSFSHKNETTSPAYYKLTAGNIVSELSTTLRCGIMQFSVLKNDSLYILIMPNSDTQQGSVQINNKTGEIWGYNPVHRIYQGWGEPAGFSGWFYIKIEKEIESKGTFSENNLFLKDSIANQKGIGVYAGFKLKKTEKLTLKIGTSFTSLEGAKKNLEVEIGDKDFAAIHTEAKQNWEHALAQIKVETSVEKDKRIFYTAIYHAMQHPRLYSDVDGSYPAFAGKGMSKIDSNRSYYDDFSMWDIYRAQLPLFELLNPDKTNDFVQSLILKGQQGSWLPIFPCWNSYTSAMIGDHATAFIASAYAKGICNYDIDDAYRLMRKNAFTVANEKDYVNGMGRRALTSYLKYNYIPLEDSVPIAFHQKEQVSRTLEYAYDDYALAVVAKGLHKTADFVSLSKRALNYKNIFDPVVGMVRGRYADGSWYKPFNQDKKEVYITEGTPRQYNFYVPQDVPGLAKLMGGQKQLENALDSLFDKGEYWHGNEPGHQIPFMYNNTKSPYKSQEAVQQILANEYGDGPGGLSGNDDAGQMSAWYVFASMGFYPLDPVSGNYMIVAPLFNSTSIKLDHQKVLNINCHKKNMADKYIKKIKWNGKRYRKNYLQHDEISKGGTLEIWLTAQPTNWGSNKKNQPKGL